MMPAASHDEQASQSFVMNLKEHISREITPGHHSLYRKRILPACISSDGKPPPTRHQLRKIMERTSFHQNWSSLMRLAQELMWEAVQNSVDKQLEELCDRARVRIPVGSLELDPNLPEPRYLAAVDQHGQPGGYHSDSGGNDVRAGAVLDRGAFLYHFGKSGGSMLDARGKTLVQHVFDRFPDLQPSQILDIGCSIGAGTLPLVESFPEAKVYGIDTAAPLLRYAHARAEQVHRKVHFRQMNGEQLQFKDASFDLTVSMVTLHETSTSALPRIIAECHRVLRPNGVMIHLEVPVRYADLEIVEQVLRDWQTYYNDEPFWGKVCETDLAHLARKAGFKDVRVGYQKQTTNPKPGVKGFSAKPDSRPGNWYILSAVK